MEIKLTTDDLVTISEAAKGIGCARLTIYRWLKAGKIAGIELAGQMYIPKTEVERCRNDKTSS